MSHSNPYDPSEFPISYDSELKISNITCNIPVDNLLESCNVNINYTSNGCWAFSPFNFSERIKFYEEKLQCDDSLCNILFNFAFPEMNTKILPRLRFNMNPFNKGQLVIFKFSTTIRRKNSFLLAKMFGFEPDLVDAFIDTETKELQRALNSSYTTLVLQPKDNITYCEDYITLVLLFQVLVVFMEHLLEYIFYFLDLQSSPLGVSCKNYIRRLMKRYVSKAGIPLVEDPSKLPQDATVENRIATLETLLREFFLDDTSLVTLKEIRTRCVRYQDKNNALRGDNLLRDDIVVNVKENDDLISDSTFQNDAMNVDENYTLMKDRIPQ
ncbi:16576_t:CDS:2 [Dentiscutata heterogama]|uniref:16576_t:CDS:1 n=1 Tax=Dentiscutata heterogama TaxID=1316150 RepID=A0ACA9KC77_9GLOM|nr:16576_t:CDS:2 [Dentiscutata heterogama]